MDLPKCKCGKDGLENHSCPFSEEIHDDSETMCNCCDDCRHECAMDIEEEDKPDRKE